MKQNVKNEAEMLSVMTKIQEQLAVLDRKVDTLMNRPAPQVAPVSKPPVQYQPQGSVRPNVPQQGRTLYKVVCADCRKDCEIPFKPSGDRPVYCKECFSRRKNSRSVRVEENIGPKVVMPMHEALQTIKEEPVKVKAKKKLVMAKKSLSKKKAVTSKKKIKK